MDTYLWGGTGSCAFLREMILQALPCNFIEARDMLGPEAQSRLDNTFLQSTNVILQAAQRNEALAQLPIGILDAVPKRVWRKKKTHGLADATGLTSAEILEQRKRLKGHKIPATLRPTKAKAGKADSRAQEDEDEEVDANLPPSTAPPRLEDSGSMEKDAREDRRLRATTRTLQARRESPEDYAERDFMPYLAVL